MSYAGHRRGIARAGAAALVLLAAAVAAEPAAGPELVPELTAYYTSLGLYVPLAGEAIPDYSGDDELELYRELLLSSLRPQLLLLEASVYPMPLLGTWIRRHEPGLYADAQLRGDINLVESASAGFPEPAALSIFLGSAMNLVRPGERRVGTNKGHVGYLASYGDRHIRRNVLIDDDWYELEWKLKGEREFADEHLSWSFRLGTKQHGDPDIADVVYVGLRRGNIDWHGPFLDWLTNSAASFKVEAASDGIARAQLLVEKRYPLEGWGFAVAVETGVLYEGARAYRGTLRDEDDGLIFVLRPNIAF
jgi:hypothetical protein